MSDAWIEVAFQIPAELVDQLSEQLIELSGNGVCIDNQTVDTFSLDSVREQAVLTIRAYFATGPELEEKVATARALHSSLCASHEGFTPSPLTLKTVNQEDWANSWKQYFHASPIGNRLLLKPSWEDCSCEGDRIVIEIDPGMAFGTGTHATTRLCLEALERIFDNAPPF
jgi:ribosomal protein L11 methyltransferase